VIRSKDKIKQFKGKTKAMSCLVAWHWPSLPPMTSTCSQDRGHHARGTCARRGRAIIVVVDIRRRSLLGGGLAAAAATLTGCARQGPSWNEPGPATVPVADQVSVAPSAITPAPTRAAAPSACSTP
jgi:hypothetical protein